MTGPQAIPWFGDTGIFQDSRSHPAAAALGPWLDVRVAYTCGKPGGTLFQRVFPYARGGAIAHTLPGQAFCGSRLPASWWRVGTETMGILRSHGMPTTMPVAVQQPAAGSGAAAAGQADSEAARPETGTSAVRGSAAAAGSSSPVVPVALAVGVAVALVVGLAVVQRRRRTIAA